MKTIFAILIAVCLVMTPLTALAGKGGGGKGSGGKGGGGQGPSQQAYEKADDNSQFKREGNAEGSEGQMKAKERHRHEETKGKAKGKEKGNKERKRSEGTQTD